MYIKHCRRKNNTTTVKYDKVGLIDLKNGIEGVGRGMLLPGNFAVQIGKGFKKELKSWLSFRMFWLATKSNSFFTEKFVNHNPELHGYWLLTNYPTEIGYD